MFKNLFLALVVCVAVIFLMTDIQCQQKKTKKKSSPTQTRTNNLSRSVAAELIKNHSEFKSILYKDVPVGRFWYDWRNVEDYFKGLQTLKDKKILTLGATGKKNGWWNEYFIELTPEGEKEAKTWEKTSRTNPSGNTLYFGPESPDCIIYKFPVREKKLLAVTGIVFGIGNQAGAEFTWAWIVTDKGKSLLNEVQSDEIYNGRASFQLYDDGWRATYLY